MAKHEDVGEEPIYKNEISATGLEMGHITKFWRKMTPTKALVQASGQLEKDFFESVYRVTYITGLSSSERSVGYLLYSNIVKLVIVLFVCGEMWYILTNASSLDAVVPSISVVLIQFITLYRYENLISNKPFYNKLAVSMDSPYFDISTEKRKELVQKWAQKNETYLKLLLFLGNSTLVTWFIYPLLDDLEYNLITDIRLPFYYKTPKLYPIVYVMVVIALWYCAYFVMVTALTTQAHLIHLSCQFSILADCFENVLSDCRKDFVGISNYDLAFNQQFAEMYTKRLGYLVKQHQMLLSYTKDLKATLSRPMLGQLAASGTMMCCVGYQAVMTITEGVVKCLVSLLFLSYNVFELYIICRWCEEITTLSSKIGEAVYCSGWECGMTRIRGVRSTIMIVIARANKPVIFTAGGMYNLSIASFASLVKGSYSSLTVLLRFRHS